MPTKEQLESALKNAHNAGDVAAAKQLANALKSGSFDVQPVQNATPVLTPAKQNIQEAKDKGFWGDVQQTKEQSRANQDALYKRFDAGKITAPEFGLGIVAEFAKTGFNILSDVTDAIIPEDIQNAVEEGVDTFESAVAPTNSVQKRLMVESLEKYKEFKEANPRLAENMENAAIVGASYMTLKTKGKKTPKPTDPPAWKLEKVLPDRTPTIQKELDRRSYKTMTGEYKVQASLHEIRMLEALDKYVPDVTKRSNAKDDLINTLKATRRLGKKLQNEYAEKGITLTKRGASNRLNVNFQNYYRTSHNMAELRAKFGRKEPPMLRTVRQATEEILNSNNKDIAGLINARRQLDDLYNSKKMFIPGTNEMKETTKSRLYKVARDSINDIIYDAMPEAGTLNKDLSLLLNASDMMNTKSHRVARTFGGRVRQAVEENVPLLGRALDRSTTIKPDR